MIAFNFNAYKRATVGKIFVKFWRSCLSCDYSPLRFLFLIESSRFVENLIYYIKHNICDGY